MGLRRVPAWCALVPSCAGTSSARQCSGLLFWRMLLGRRVRRRRPDGCSPSTRGRAPDTCDAKNARMYSANANAFIWPCLPPQSTTSTVSHKIFFSVTAGVAQHDSCTPRTLLSPPQDADTVRTLRLLPHQGCHFYTARKKRQVMVQASPRLSC